MKTTRIRRSLPIGAEVQPDGGVHFRVWAPRHRKMEVELEAGPGSRTEGRPVRVPLEQEEDGYFSGLVETAADGTRYRFRTDDGKLLADPASRWQPEGINGPSQVVDPRLFRWTDHD